MSLLETAIANRSVVAFEYDGDTRFVEPHALGKKSNDALLLRGFQTGGASDSLNFGWKLFTVDKITNLRIAPPRAQYNPVDKAMVGGVLAALPLDVE